MAQQPSLSDKDRADLIAYLDGELNERAAREVETRLHRDPTARAEVEALRRTWALLDYLPRPEPSAHFTHRTLTRVEAVRTHLVLPRTRPRWQLWALGLGWVAALMLAGFGGYGATRLLPRRQPPQPIIHAEPERKPEPAPVRDPDAEWLAQAVRADLAKKTPPERDAELRRLRQQAQRRQEDWLIAFRNWDELAHDRPFAHFTRPGPFLDSFVKSYVEVLLSKGEVESLHRTEGHWPDYPRRLVELIDLHPLALPGPPSGPTRFEDLPADVQQVLEKANLKDRLRPHEGSWPSYAILVTEAAAQSGVHLPRPLGPCRLHRMKEPSHSEHVPSRVQQFIRRELLNRPDDPLRPEERKRLLAAEGRWPEFPREAALVAREHRVPLPRLGVPSALVRLPGQPAYWDRYRIHPVRDSDSTVDVPAQTLVEFALFDLSPKQRAMLQASFGDPAGYERLKRAYLKAHGVKKPG
jgi:hypothetical protein